MTRRRATVFGVLSSAILSACASGPDEVPGPKPPPPSPPAERASEAAPSASAPAPPPKPTLAELQRAALKSLVDAFAAHDAKKVAALYSADVVSGAPSPTGWSEEKGSAAIEESHARLFAAFPDMSWLSPRAWLHGEVVIQEWVSIATHTGDLGGMKASGKLTGVHGISVYRFGEDGLIREDDTYYDAATIARQTGAMPGAARPVPDPPRGEMIVTASSGSPDEAKRAQAARAMYAAFSGGDEKAFLATLHEDVAQRAFAAPADQKGHKAASEGYRAMHKAFPDISATATEVWGFGDRVIAVVKTTGTHKGALGSIKPTKRSVTLRGLDVLTVGEDGKITSIDSYGSSLSLLGQLGALPAPPKPKDAAPAKK